MKKSITLTLAVILLLLIFPSATACNKDITEDKARFVLTNALTDFKNQTDFTLNCTISGKENNIAVKYIEEFSMSGQGADTRLFMSIDSKKYPSAAVTDNYIIYNSTNYYGRIEADYYRLTSYDYAVYKGGSRDSSSDKSSKGCMALTETEFTSTVILENYFDYILPEFDNMDTALVMGSVRGNTYTITLTERNTEKDGRLNTTSIKYKIKNGKINEMEFTKTSVKNDFTDIEITGKTNITYNIPAIELPDKANYGG